ncbi:hypothetical protein ACQYAD_18195 [Neobacillus sp. SM06]|uniref:hypothetical protein n=1 Tax=Neobacillus sp. SM06 TaxID=3422492 RepID=UPI003D2BC758
MNYYKLWAIALFLKVIGSSWDASYHFKYLFEEYSIPHLVNFSGFILGGILLFQEYRKPFYLSVSSKIWITIGYILFIIGIPLDFTYHLLRGIDLTTWSPTHFIYYVATGVIIYGVWTGYYHYHPVPPSWKSLHTFWAFFMVEVLLFPNMQQENGAISLYEFLHHQSIASKEILELIKDPKSQIFGGVPDWVYPVYGSSVIILLSTIMAKMLKDLRIVLAGTAGYILYRYAAKFIFHLVVYPTSFVPIMAIGIPLVLYFSRKVTVLSSILAGLAYFSLLEFFSVSGLAITPPVSWAMYPLVLAGNVIAFYIGKYALRLYKKSSMWFKKGVLA